MGPDVDGDVALTVVKELQRHPIRGNVLHIDFLRVSADAEITVDVPIVLDGEAKAVASAGGTVDQLLYALSINAKPADIPNEITVDVTDLEIGASILVGDLKLPAGVSTDVDAEESVVAAKEAIVEDLPEAGEGDGEAAADGGDAPAEASDAAGDEAAAEGDGEG